MAGAVADGGSGPGFMILCASRVRLTGVSRIRRAQKISAGGFGSRRRRSGAWYRRARAATYGPVCETWQVADRSGVVIVVGSINRDYLLNVDRRPDPGETVLSRSLVLESGGKGANQAVAASRMGARTYVVGAVGADADGTELLSTLAGAGVRTDYITVTEQAPTGRAFITVTADGENAIVVAPGANAGIADSAVRTALRDVGADNMIVVISTELDVTTVTGSIRSANEIGARIVLNLAPFVRLATDDLQCCDPLVVNEGEASALAAQTITDVETAQDAAANLRRHARAVVITLGPHGAVVATADAVRHLSAPTVDVVDTTGAGDAFVGALAARLSAGDDLFAAVQVGVAAGSFAVTGLGAQSSYATQELLRSLG
jgi:ribokinase